MGAAIQMSEQLTLRVVALPTYYTRWWDFRFAVDFVVVKLWWRIRHTTNLEFDILDTNGFS